ncbi:MAG TPA: NDP-sugar synthase [Candidatus Sulfotelmatobacter sp.]|nr:NDP-sugar synthase [Candidatus Sulfotelmatobacter sp.]
MLAGGFATRLRPLSCTRPKTLFPILNKPLLQWIFERLVKDDVNEAILAVNQLTEFYIKQHRIPRTGLTVKYSHDPPKKPLGTAGPIKHAQHLLGNEPFFVLNGDIFADIDYKELWKSHTKTGAVATLALCRVEDPSRFGVAELAENGQIKRFIEKPAKGTEPSKFINAGAYVLNTEVLQLIPENRAASMEHEIFPRLAEEGKLYGYIFNGLWIDIGKPQEYLQTNKILLDMLKPKPNLKANQYEIRKPIAIDKKVSIGKAAIIGPYTVLGKNVTIGNNVEISNSVVLQGTKIANNVRINGAIIGEEAIIEENVKITEGCIIGDHAKIRKNATPPKNTTVCPAKEIF